MRKAVLPALVVTAAFALALLFIPGVLEADTDYFVNNEPQVGTACMEKNGFLFAAYTGIRPILIPGRVFTIDSRGVTHHLKKAKFWTTESPKQIPIKNPLGNDGTFTLDIGLNLHVHRSCQNGVVVEEEWVNDGKILVRAKGCKDKLVDITEHTTDLSIEMDCVDR